MTFCQTYLGFLCFLLQQAQTIPQFHTLYNTSKFHTFLPSVSVIIGSAVSTHRCATKQRIFSHISRIFSLQFFHNFYNHKFPNLLLFYNLVSHDKILFTFPIPNLMFQWSQCQRPRPCVRSTHHPPYLAYFFIMSTNS